MADGVSVPNEVTLLAQASERAIMAQTGHTDVDMVSRYIQSGQLFAENTPDGLGL